MNIDKDKVAFAIKVINQIIIDGERYYIDDWTNALHYAKNILESHLGDNNINVGGIDTIIQQMNNTYDIKETKRLYDGQSHNNDDQHGDNINW